MQQGANWLRELYQVYPLKAIATVAATATVTAALAVATAVGSQLPQQRRRQLITGPVLQILVKPAIYQQPQWCLLRRRSHRRKAG